MRGRSHLTARASRTKLDIRLGCKTMKTIGDTGTVWEGKWVVRWRDWLTGTKLQLNRRNKSPCSLAQ